MTGTKSICERVDGEDGPPLVQVTGRTSWASAAEFGEFQLAEAGPGTQPRQVRGRVLVWDMACRVVFPVETGGGGLAVETDRIVKNGG